MNDQTPMRRYIVLSAFVFFSFFFIFFDSSNAQELAQVTTETIQPQKITLTVGKSIIIRSPKPVKRVSLASPDIADALVITPQQIYLTGKAPGLTNITLWEDDRISTIVDLEVSPDVFRLKEKLYEILPDEKDVRITATHDSITLSGTVSSTANLSQILSLAESYAPKKVNNLLQVAGVHQVMLEVRIAEISRNLLKRLGFNFNYISTTGRSFGLSMLNKLSMLPSEGAFPKDPLRVSENINAIFRFFGEGATWTMLIDALKEEGLLKILAEPTLITLSGKTGNFLAGGEFPVPIPQTWGTITVDYKTFGVGLNFTPTVLSNGKISMQVAPEVSDLDFSKSISIMGFLIPSLTTRRASTTIELADGQSFAIAGLLKDDIREIVSKFPILGDIPILGALFRSSSFQKNETELVIIVTVHLVKPLDMAKQTLPTDQYIEPNDFEFYLLGSLEGGKGTPSGKISGKPRSEELGLEGEFGHIVPKE